MGFFDAIMGVVKKILGTVLFPIKPIIDPLIMFGEMNVKLLELLLNALKLVPKLLSLFEIFTDPIKLIKDFIFGIKAGFLMLFDALFGNIINAFAGLFMDSENKDKNKNEKSCFKNTFIETLLLVLCPPLALFVKKGIGSSLNIIIASVLTYFYYIPGLIYTALYIL